MSFTITISEEDAQEIIEGKVPESVKTAALTKTTGAQELAKAKKDIASAVTLLLGVGVQSDLENALEVIRELDKADETILSAVIRVSAKHNIHSPRIGDMVFNGEEWEPANWNSSSYDC